MQTQIKETIGKQFAPKYSGTKYINEDIIINDVHYEGVKIW